MLSTVATPLRTAGRAPQLARAFSASASSGAKRKDVLRIKFTPSKDRYPVAEAVRILRALEVGSPESRFDLELITKVPKQGHLVRGQVTLPTDPRKGNQEEVLVVFAEEGSATERMVKEIPGVIVGQSDLIEPLVKGRIKPTRVFATPGMNPTVAKSLGRFLGPKGLMPNAKRGTLAEGRRLIDLIHGSGSKIDWSANDLGVVRFSIGKAAWTSRQIEENVRAFVTAVAKAGLGVGEVLDQTSRKKADSE